MTLEGLYKEGIRLLEVADIAEARLDAWYLLEYVTGLDRTSYYMKLQDEVSKKEEVDYFSKVQRRALRIPLQHITGVQEFMGLEFFVNDQVLIPRQDTECLVEAVEEILTEKTHILDMCTGSGCIIISLCKRNKTIITGIGVDISTGALEVGRENNERQGTSVTFLESDLFQNVHGKYDIIVSNPPYIQTEEIRELEKEVRLYDPMLALDGKEDGLHFYKEIVKKSPEYLEVGGHLYFEIGSRQGQAVSDLMKETGFAGVTIKKDLVGLDRIVCGVYNKAEK